MLKRFKTFTSCLAILLGSSNFTFAEIVAETPSSLPQLNAAYYPSQIFWLVVSFFLFYLFCVLFIVPRIRSIVQNRRDHITFTMEEANGIALQAEKYTIRAEETLKRAKDDAHKELSTKKHALTSNFEKSAKEMTDTAYKKISTQIENLKKSARDAAPEMIEKISSEITSEIILKLSDIDPEVRLIKESVKKELNDKELVA